MKPLQAAATAILLVALATSATGQQQMAQAPSAAPRGPQTGARMIKVDRFDRISVCTPLINTLIAPSSGSGNYSIGVVSADPVPLTAEVRDGELVLGTAGDFSTSRAIKVVVFVEPSALKKVASAPLSSDVFMDRGFKPDGGEFTMTSHLATGRQVIRGMEADKVYIAGSGGSAFFANASRGAEYKVDLGGVSSAAIFNDPKAVDLLLSGAAAVDVHGGAGTTVRGAALGANTAIVPIGTTCTVTGPFGLGSPCNRVRQLPDVGMIPLWSCGLRATGAFTCPAPPKNGAADGIQAAAAPMAAPGALATQPLAQAAPMMAAPAPAAGQGQEVASGGRRLAQAAAAAGGGGMPGRYRPEPLLTNWAGSSVSLLPCTEAPIDLVMGMDGM